MSNKRPSALTGEQVIELVEQEIQWCLSHPDDRLSGDYQDGFRAGLQQTITIINQVDDKIRSGLEGAMIKALSSLDNRHKSL